ncbi:MAG: recombinase family protein [Candidatus Omnitrophica bacterium]|nr:recombinase family protein [Candidatus Omnitrophota bacterium]
MPSSIKVVQDIDKVDVDILGEGAALYIRVTKEESVKKGLSIPNQRNRGIEIAERRKWNWVKVYQEPRHVGGDQWIDKRVALAQLIEDIKTGKIRHVFVRHQDRLWRSAEVQVKLLKIFKEYDIDLWDFDRQKDFRTASGKLTLGVEGTVSEYEKDITAERIREMKRGKARSGRSSGGPPTFGYITQKRLHRELMKQEKISSEDAYTRACREISNAREWFVDQSEAEVVIFVLAAYSFRHPSEVSFKTWNSLDEKSVQRISAMYEKVDRALGSRNISYILNANGYKRRGGTPWVGSKILRIINDPTVFGFITYDNVSYEKRKPSSLPKFLQTFYKGVHEPIIKPSLWEEIQTIKKQKSTSLRTKNKTGTVFPLSHILVCGKCKAPMRAKSQGRGRNYAYYMCRNRCYYGLDVHNNPNACDFPSVNVVQAEHAIWEWLLEQMDNPKEIVRLMDQSNKRIKDDQPKAKIILLQKKDELEKNKEKINKYYFKYEQAKDEIEVELSWDKLVELKKERQQIDEDIINLEQQLKIQETPLVSQDKVGDYVQELRKFLIENKNKRRVLYQVLQAKHDFKVIAHGKYCIEPQLSFISNSTFIEIDPSNYPSTTDDDSQFIGVGTSSTSSLAYRYGSEATKSNHKFTRDFAYPPRITASGRTNHDHIVISGGGNF